MAHNYQLALVALLFAAATPLAHGQVLQAVNIVGRLCCTSTGNCVGGAPGVSGAPLVLKCTTVIGAVVTLAQGVTGDTGAFNLSTTGLQGAIGSVVADLQPCKVLVSLPIINSTVCAILNTAAGLLVAIPTVVSSALSPVNGLVANLNVTEFVIANATVG